MSGTNEEKSKYENLADHELVECCQTGNRVAFEILVKKNQRRVFTLLYQLAPDWKDLNDLSQEVFIRVYRGIANLRNSRTFKQWLNQIVLNLFYDELRKRPRRLKTISLDQGIESEDSAHEFMREAKDTALGPEELSFNNELSQLITSSMEQLPEQFRTVIVLRELQGLQYEEIAEMLDCALGTVKSRIWRARDRLQEILGPKLQEYGYLNELGEEDKKYA